MKKHRKVKVMANPPKLEDPGFIRVANVGWGPDGSLRQLAPRAFTHKEWKKREEAARDLERRKEAEARGRKLADESRQAKAAEDSASLLADVSNYRLRHSRTGRPAIAKALVSVHGKPFDDKDTVAKQNAIEALRQRIQRLENPPKKK